MCIRDRGDSEDVFGSEHCGNHRRLDRRRRFVAFSRHGLKERPGESEVMELFQVGTFVRRGAMTMRPMALDGIMPLRLSVWMDCRWGLLEYIGDMADRPFTNALQRPPTSFSLSTHGN